MRETKRESDKIRWCFKTNKYILWLREDRGRMRSYAYTRSFMNLENAWQALSKKRTLLAMGTSLWGFDSTAGFLKRIEAEVRTKFRTRFRLFSTVIIPVTNVRTEQAQIQWKVFKFGWVWKQKLDEVHKCQMNRWSWEWNQQGDKAEIAVCRGGKQETPLGGLQREDKGRGTAKIRAETKAVLRLQGREEVSKVNYGKKDPCAQMLGLDRRVRSGICVGSSSSQGAGEFPCRSLWQFVCGIIASPGFITSLWRPICPWQDTPALHKPVAVQ